MGYIIVVAFCTASLSAIMAFGAEFTVCALRMPASIALIVICILVNTMHCGRVKCAGSLRLHVALVASPLHYAEGAKDIRVALHP
jgi:hypothetical protein